jgi:hypothetical protein
MNIATTLAFASRFNHLPPPWDAEYAARDATATILGTLFLPSLSVVHLPSPFSIVPQVPSPLSTASFPDRTGPGRKRRRRTGQPVNDCPICIGPLTGSIAYLACGHGFHRQCLFGLLTPPVLGASSMLRCPMCRAPIDRYDLGALGCDVSPQRLVIAERRCDALRQLAIGCDGNQGLAACLVQQCNGTEALTHPVLFAAQ